jgi:hypothetical protein
MRRLHVNSLGSAALAALILACWPASQADALPDAQGWNGPGWYITGSAPPTPQPVAAPDYILFDGPHALPGECIKTYDRLYSPIGTCRLLNAKPAALGG